MSISFLHFGDNSLSSYSFISPYLTLVPSQLFYIWMVMLSPIASLSSNHHLGLKWVMNLGLSPFRHASRAIVAMETLLDHGGNDDDESISQTRNPWNLTTDVRTLKQPIYLKYIYIYMKALRDCQSTTCLLHICHV